MNSIGGFRNLNNRYYEHRKEFKNQSFSKGGGRQQSLNDSGLCLNENKKSPFLNTNPNKTGPLELQHWNLPPKYMEIFDNTSDLFKEFQLKCKL